MTTVAEQLVSQLSERLSGIKVVYTDLDGTMLGRNGSFLHDRDGKATLQPAEALLAARAALVDVVPASGRALRGLQTDARLLGLATVIAEMGAQISYDFGRDVVQNFGETPKPGMPAAIMEEVGAVKLLLERFAGLLEHHTPWSGWRECTHLFRGKVDPEEADSTLAGNGFGWLTLHDNGRLHGEYMGIPKGAARAYHLIPRGVSKGLAVAIDREHAISLTGEDEDRAADVMRWPRWSVGDGHREHRAQRGIERRELVTARSEPLAYRSVRADPPAHARRPSLAKCAHPPRK